MRKKQFQYSLIIITALLVCLIALLAGGSLWLLRRIHDQQAHTEAAQTVLSKGKIIVEGLADQPAVLAGRTYADWSDFSRMVEMLYLLENGIEYVAVNEDGATIFQEHMGTLNGATTERDAVTHADDINDVLLQRKLVRIGEEDVPVVSFAKPLLYDEDRTGFIEVGIRKEVVEREEQSLSKSIGSMFTLSLVTVIVSFGICVWLVVWMMYREHRRELQRREEEHLAFSGVLANGIVHDFRNPMSSMRLDVQMLQREVEKGAEGNPEKITRLAGRVCNTMDRMDNIFKEFLYLSKPELEETVIRDVNVLVNDCTHLMTTRFEHAGITLDLDLVDGHTTCAIIETAFRRALLNILVNAEQFSRENGTIRIATSMDDDWIFVDVVDNGAGIPKSKRRHVFSMFFTTRPQGTGLGLFFAKATIERSGGQIRIMDKKGPGTWIRIMLPKCKTENETKEYNTN